MNKPNFRRAQEEAYKIILSQERFSFPINPLKIKLPGYNIQIVSLQEYASIVGFSINDLTLNSTFNDGYTYKRGNFIFIFYNNFIDTKERITWTIAHELGHIVLGHQTQSDINEVEANFFAAQLLVPQCVLMQLIKNGVNLTPQYISSKFRISNEASQHCIETLKKVIDKNISTEYDDIIINLFNPYVLHDYSYDNFLDELENRREDFF